MSFKFTLSKWLCCFRKYLYSPIEGHLVWSPTRQEIKAPTGRRQTTWLNVIYSDGWGVELWSTICDTTPPIKVVTVKNSFKPPLSNKPPPPTPLAVRFCNKPHPSLLSPLPHPLDETLNRKEGYLYLVFHQAEVNFSLCFSHFLLKLDCYFQC